MENDHEATTPTEQRPLTGGRTRYGRAVVVGATVLSTSLMLQARATQHTTAAFAVASGGQPEGDPCYVEGTVDFPQGLQNVAGYETLGLPYGGILLADRGQFPELHGNMPYDVPSKRITRGYDALLEACEGGADCQDALQQSCSIIVTDEADAQLSCIEGCVESRFRDFLGADGAPSNVFIALDKEGACYYPILSAFTSTPSLVKSCLDPAFESPVENDCYDCISACLGDTAAGVLRLDCGAAPLDSGVPLTG